MNSFLSNLFSGIRERNIFNKSLGLSYLFTIGLFPVLLVLLGVSGYLINKLNAIVRVNNYLYDILPVEKEFKEAILNNVFITSEQLTANYLIIFISGIITFCIVFYYVINYIRSTITDGISNVGLNKLDFGRFSFTMIICSVLFFISFLLSTLIFDPFSLIKSALELHVGIKILAFILTIVVSYFIFKIFLSAIFSSEVKQSKTAVIISVITFEVFKLFYLYYIFFISRPFRLTGIIEMLLISFVMLFYFSMLMYISVEYRLALSGNKNSNNY